MRFRVRGMNSAIWKMKMCEMWLLLISWTMSRVTGTGGAFLAAASARSFSPALARVATLRILVSVCSTFCPRALLCCCGHIAFSSDHCPQGRPLF